MRKATFLLIVLPLFSWGQVLKPASWEVDLEPGNPEVGDEAQILFKVKIDKNWYLYSSDFDPDLGPMVTEFEFVPNDSYELVGDIVPVNPGKKYDSLWEGEYTYFKKEALFKQKVKTF